MKRWGDAYGGPLKLMHLGHQGLEGAQLSGIGQSASQRRAKMGKHVSQVSWVKQQRHGCSRIVLWQLCRLLPAVVVTVSLLYRSLWEKWRKEWRMAAQRLEADEGRTRWIPACLATMRNPKKSCSGRCSTGGVADSISLTQNAGGPT